MFIPLYLHIRRFGKVGHHFGTTEIVFLSPYNSFTQTKNLSFLLIMLRDKGRIAIENRGFTDLIFKR